MKINKYFFTIFEILKIIRFIISKKNNIKVMEKYMIKE